jgi:hypothetical protein
MNLPRLLALANPLRSVWAETRQPSVASAGAVQDDEPSDGDQETHTEADPSPPVAALDSAEIAAADGADGERHEWEQATDSEHPDPILGSRG